MDALVKAREAETRHLDKFKRKFDYKRQSIADAIIDLGAEADVDNIAARTNYDRALIERILVSNTFMRYFKARCIQRGYTLDVAEERHRKDYHRIDLLRSAILHDPSVSNKLTLKDLCAVERSIAQSDLMRRQNEHFKTMSRSDEKARMMNHEEIMARLKTTEAGKRFLFKKALEQGLADTAGEVEGSQSTDQPAG